MHATSPILTTGRAAQLHAIGRSYVTQGLGRKDFDAIPYAEDVVLRAPFCPGGSTTPLVGRESLKTIWWPPLPHLVSDVRIIDSYVNADHTAVTIEFHCDIREPACTLRILDRFTVDADGRIVDQENFFDPRDVTHSGWREAAPASSSREDIVGIVQRYLDGLGNRDFGQVPFAADFTYQSPLLMATIGQPKLVGREAIDFLTGLFPAIRGTRIKQHIVEGEYCATVFDLDTIYGTIPIFDRFHVVGGELKLANPFYDPAPILRGVAVSQPADAGGVDGGERG